MIVFGVPSVGQIRPETFFGEDDHYGFLQTLVSEFDVRPEIKKKCQKYYNKDTDKYWDQIITIINFLAVRNIDDQNVIRSNEILDLISEEYDKGKTGLSDLLFEYFVCNWQFPHPVITKKALLQKDPLGIFVENQKSLKPIKPLNAILKVLLHLYDTKPANSFLTDFEFFHYVVQYYRENNQAYLIESPEIVAQEIIQNRKSGIVFYEPLNDYLKGKPYLSYPKGFLKNLKILTYNPTVFNQEEIFIGFDHLNFQRDDLIKYINSSSGIFSTQETSYASQRSAYYKHIYNSNRLAEFANQVGSTIKEIEKLNVSSEPNQNLSYDEIRIQRQLKRLTTLDVQSIQRRRTEQNLLRRHLFNDSDKGNCALCSKDFPIQFLTTAHIKKRSLCDDLEKRDINIVMPACQFGCDKLYENGYVYVEKGVITPNNKIKVTTKSVSDYISTLRGKKCTYFSERNKKYFDDHREKYAQLH